MRLRRLWLAAPLLALTAADDTLLLQPLMKTVVAPQGQVAGDLTINAMDDNGKPDASKLPAGDWAKLESAGQALAAAGTRMAEAKAITVAEAGAKLQNEETPGSPGAAQVQRVIDGDRAGFADQARGFAAIAGELAAAAKVHDAAKLIDASGRLDEACQACHAKYWYPPAK